MSAGWVAATNRGRSLLRGTLGRVGAKRLAQAESWESARSQLEATMYGAQLDGSSTRREAHAATLATTAWQLQVLAGWCPPNGGGIARLVAAPLEIADIEAKFVGHSSHEHRRPGTAPTIDEVHIPIALGALGNTAVRLRTARSAEEARQILARSPWGDPGGVDEVTVALGLRLSWLARVIRRFPQARGIATDGMAVLAARERFVFGRDIAPAPAHELDRHLGSAWRSASTIDSFASVLPRGSFALSGIDSPDDLWRAEALIITALRVAAEQWVGRTSFGERSVAGIMILLLIDAFRTTAAIELAGRGPLTPELLDVLA